MESEVMENITHEIRNYILNQLLMFMKNTLEELGSRPDACWFEIKIPESIDCIGSKEPIIEDMNEETKKFLSKCPCSKNELDVAMKYGYTNGYILRNPGDEYSIQLTPAGLQKATEYESYLIRNIGNNEIILNDSIPNIDDELTEIIQKSRRLLISNDLDGALEKIWDAFERIKTILNKDKKKGVQLLCQTCATSLPKEEIEKEFKELTKIGNDYQIRHFETSKIPLKDENTKSHLYFRMLTLLNFGIKQIKVQQDGI